MTIQELYKAYKDHPTISTDSRNVPAGSIFFALKGANFDGNKFAQGALDQGAAFCVIDNSEYKTDDRCILVNDCLETLQQLALYHRQQLKIPVLGITGTNGKTTTKELLNAVLSRKYKTLATKGNLNNHIGVPLTLLSITPDIELAIIEMGANHQGEIAFLCNIALPSYGLISNVGKAHLEGFGGFEGVKKTKGELYTFLKQHRGTIFINGANEHLKEMLGDADQVVWYGPHENTAVEAQIIENDPFLTIDWQHQGFSHRVKTQLTGSYNLENIMAAIATGLQFELDAEQINIGLSSYVPGNNRSQIIKTERNTLIGDYYNANPSSMFVALDNLNGISSETKVAILGDMFELGDESESEHRAVIDKALTTALQTRIFIGEAFFALKDHYANRAFFYKTTDDAIEHIPALNLKDAMILVKGSRGMRLEKLIDLL